MEFEITDEDFIKTADNYIKRFETKIITLTQVNMLNSKSIKKTGFQFKYLNNVINESLLLLAEYYSAYSLCLYSISLKQEEASVKKIKKIDSDTFNIKAKSINPEIIPKKIFRMPNLVVYVLTYPTCPKMVPSSYSKIESYILKHKKRVYGDYMASFNLSKDLQKEYNPLLDESLKLPPDLEPDKLKPAESKKELVERFKSEN